MMACPACGGASTVSETRAHVLNGKPILRRRRACSGCGRRWSTAEVEIPDGRFRRGIVLVNAGDLENARRLLQEASGYLAEHEPPPNAPAATDAEPPRDAVEAWDEWYRKSNEGAPPT